MRVKWWGGTRHRALCKFGPFCITLELIINHCLRPGSLSNRASNSRFSGDCGNQLTSAEIRGVQGKREGERRLWEGHRRRLDGTERTEGN